MKYALIAIGVIEALVFGIMSFVLFLKGYNMPTLSGIWMIGKAVWFLVLSIPGWVMFFTGMSGFIKRQP